MIKPPLKTYSHLAGARRVPTEYEVATTQLLYYVAKGGFEVNVPTRDWYRRHQAGSPLACSPETWGRFRDPRATTYTSYIALQKRQEEHLDDLMRPLDDGARDRTMPVEWRALLDRALTPQRHLFHGLQMLAAYVGQMAPEGRVVITAALQAADEMRRVQRISYRMAQLRIAHPGFGATSRDTWQQDPAWQPARRAVELALVTYDWGEALVALNVCLKPALDHLLVVELGRMADAAGDFVLREMMTSFAADCAWHRAWTRALVDVARGERQDLAEHLARWLGRWMPLADEAIGGAAALLGGDADSAAAAARAALRTFARDLREGAQ
jgi:toluene monooxygenase system protein E